MTSSSCTDSPFRDTQCGAKVLDRRLVDRVVPLLSSRDFVFDVDLLVTAGRLGYRVVEVPTVWVDQPGSRINVGTDSKRMAASLVRLWLQHRLSPVSPAPVAYPDDPIAARAPVPLQPVDIAEDAHVA